MIAQLALFSVEELPVPPGWRIVGRAELDGEPCYRVRGKVQPDPAGKPYTVELWKTAAGLRAMTEAVYAAQS